MPRLKTIVSSIIILIILAPFLYADEVNVKVTDISGNLVYETDALGGQAVWDGKTFNGRKISTGVYLVFCSNEDGSQTFVTKFLFMN